MEDLVSTDPRLMHKLFFALFVRNMTHQALGLMRRHKIAWNDFAQETAQTLPPYNPSFDTKPEDKFAPFNQAENVMQMPKNVNSHWIDSDSSVMKLNALFGKKFIGVDSEWKANGVNLNA